MKKLYMVYLKICEKILPYFGKDNMKKKICYYRLKGAKIGENVRAFSPILSSEPYLIEVGDNVTISTNVKFCTHDNSAIKMYSDATDFVGKIEIGNNCFVGMNSILMLGVKIADNCLVGAGSVVTKSCFEEGKILAGNPARIIGTIEEAKVKNSQYKFDFRGLNRDERKNEILRNVAKWKRK